MFIGHFGIANAAAAALPQVPPLIIYAGVSFPDLLWAPLVLAQRERVKMDPADPLQSRIDFQAYPFSHSLGLTNLIALVPAGLIALATHSFLNGAVFVLASISHWLLDVVVHRRDLPLWGFGRDRRVGWGLWLHPGAAFALEYAVYVVPTVLFVPADKILSLLLAGTLFHMANSNTFFRFTRRNPFPSPASYATLALVGFVALSLALNGIMIA